jgi:hypothetical protein
MTEIPTEQNIHLINGTYSDMQGIIQFFTGNNTLLNIPLCKILNVRKRWRNINCRFALKTLPHSD